MSIKKFLLSMSALSVFVLLTSCTLKDNGDDADNGTDVDTQGTLYISVTDAAADMGAVNEIAMNISDAQIYSDTKGWMALGVDNDDFNLLELKENAELKLFIKEELDAGDYSKLKLKIDKVEVKNDADMDEKAYLAASEIEIDADIKVESEMDSHVTLDFLADESLYMTVDKKAYVFAPVIEVKSESGVTIDADVLGKVTLSGGTVEDETSVGVDADGKVKVNFKLEDDAKLKIINGKVELDVDAGADTEVDVGVDVGGSDDGGGIIPGY